jgi:hypothetical protein
MVHVMLFPMLNPLYVYISTFLSMCAAPSMADLCSSLISFFPGMFLSYFLNVLQIVPVARIITGITFVFNFYMRFIYSARLFYFRIFSAFFLITYLSVSRNCNIY